MKDLNKKHKSEYILRWAKKIRAIRFLGGKCKYCGNDDFVVLEFHHLNQKDKDTEVAVMLGLRWTSLEKELKKCILLCKNCHQEQRATDARNKRLKKKLLELKGVDKCEKCGHSGLASLCFHHKGGKKFEVNAIRMRFADVSLDKLLLEMDKCEVLCSNCHQIEHIDIEKLNGFKELIIEKSFEYLEPSKRINREEIRKLYFDEKNSQTEIANRLGCRKSTICMAIKNMQNAL